MKRQMIISVMAKDRAGIVAAISGTIFQLNGDLATINQTVVHGYFTMIVSAVFDTDITKTDLLKTLETYQLDDIELSVKSLDQNIDLSASEPVVETYIMTLQAPNKKGLVSSISSFCHQHKINIIDLSTSLDDDTFTMILQLDFSQVESITTVENDLQQFKQDKNLNIMLQHYDIFKATNEISLR